MKKNKQIGQGIGALLTPQKSSDTVEQNSILITKIIPNPNQPRKVFDKQSLAQLAQSIDEKGLISPITVKESNNKYNLCLSKHYQNQYMTEHCRHILLFLEGAKKLRQELC